MERMNHEQGNGCEGLEIEIEGENDVQRMFGAHSADTRIEVVYR